MEYLFPNQYYYNLQATIASPDENLDAKDYAIEEMEKLAKAGNNHACHYMGKEYLEGNLLIRDSQLAMEYFKMSAQNGFADSQYELGKLYLSNDILVRNVSKGFQTLDKAFENGSDCAGYLLGKEFLSGVNFPKDESESMYYLAHSSDAGNVNAQYLLGKLLYQQKEITDSVYYLQLATNQGSIHAKGFLERIESHKDPNAMLAVGHLILSIANIFQDNSLPATSSGISMDKKARRKLNEKKLAQGKKIEHTQGHHGISMAGY